MRIRSIRPEFWASEDIAALDWAVRLIFIGLWSYVDDNGVGRDVPKLIKADLLPLEDDPHEALMQVTGALLHLESGGQICRYVVDGKPLLHICAWEKHQVIQRPSKARYERLTCEDARKSPNPHASCMRPPANSAPGEGEKGRRGEGEERSCASTDVEREIEPHQPSIDDEFATWYATYPRKRGKGQALKAYRSARKKTDAQTLLDAVERQRDALIAKGADFCPHPATWLNGERWDDEPDSALPVPVAPPTGRAGERAAMYDRQMQRAIERERQMGIRP